MIRVLLADDHALVRQGTRMILEQSERVEVIGEAEDGEQALTQVHALKPDVVLMDLNMPGMGGFEATRRLCSSGRGCKVIVLTMLSDSPFPRQLLSMGAAGFLSKTCSAVELLEAVEKVHAGGRYINPEIAQRLALALLPGADQSPIDQLSPRELDIAMRIVNGHKPADISADLHMNKKTISTHKARVLSKLNVRNAIELTHFFIRHGLAESQSLN